MNDQYREDCAKLAGLMERYTGIPKERVFRFVMENTTAELLQSANFICDTEIQRQKLGALYEFKNLYDTVKISENSREYKLTSAATAQDYFKSYFADANDKERLAAVFLDSQHRVIATKTITIGTVNESPVYPREIVKEALFYNAASVMLGHNHPGGATDPSRADIEMTARVKDIMESVSIDLLDHIIVAGEKTISLAERGMLSGKKAALKPAKAMSSRETGGDYDNRPSIRQQLAAGRELIARLTAPSRAATKSNNLEV